MRAQGTRRGTSPSARLAGVIRTMLEKTTRAGQTGGWLLGRCHDRAPTRPLRLLGGCVLYCFSYNAGGEGRSSRHWCGLGEGTPSGKGGDINKIRHLLRPGIAGARSATSLLATSMMSMLELSPTPPPVLLSWGRRSPRLCAHFPCCCFYHASPLPTPQGRL